jgi:hypothetical protein
MLALTGQLGLAACVAAQTPERAPMPAPVPSLPYVERVLSLKPAGYWRLTSSKSSTIVDISGHKRDGVMHGKRLFDLPSPITGDTEKVLALDGKSYVEIPDHKAFSVSHAGLTVEAWLRLAELDFPGQTGAGDDPYVHWLGKGEKDAFEWGFRLYSKHKKNGELSGRPNRTSAYIWNPKAAAPGTSNEGAGAYFEDELKPHQWMHIVAVYDPPGSDAGVRIYRDGMLRKGPPDKGTLYRTFDIKPEHGSAPLRLGTRDLGSFLIGGLGDVAVYPRMLSAAEIKENYRLATQKPHRKRG